VTAVPDHGCREAHEGVLPLRKFSFTIFGVVAVIALTSGLALGKTRHARAHPSQVKCGTLYTKPCTPPVLHVPALRPACKPSGSVIRLGAITLRDNGGLRSVTVKFGRKTIRSIKFKGAPTSKTIKGIKVGTRGLRSGVVYKIVVRMVDTRGKSRTRILHFAICAPKPVFTG
jgi:hypothetical protein